MSLNMEQIVIVGLGLVFLLLAFLVLIPTTPRSQRRKRFPYKVREKEVKDWQAVSLKLERVIRSLKRQMAETQKEQKLLERDLVVQKEKYAKLQNKIDQERGWQKKERSDVDKKGREVIRLREDFKKAEQHLAQEHADRLRLERQQKELNASLSSAQTQIKDLENQIIKHKAHIDAYRSEITALRAEAQKLTKKHNEETWVAKSEFTKLKKDYESLEAELKKYRPET